MTKTSARPAPPAVAAFERRTGLRRGGELPAVPVILTDATRHWPATGRWTPAHLASEVGDRMVVVDGVRMSIRHLVGMIDRSTAERPAPYLRAQKVREVMPELAPDLTPVFDDARPNWAESRLLPPSVRRARLPEILLGGAGASFHVLHYDKDHLHAFISQIFGRKRLFVFAPDQAVHLYPKPATPNQSEVDVHAPDLERHPRFADAAMSTATLEPGETIYLPPGWWHTTRMDEPSISVTWNMLDRSNWDAFASATRRRVEARTVPALGAVFGAYASAFGAARARR